MVFSDKMAEEAGLKSAEEMPKAHIRGMEEPDAEG